MKRLLLPLLAALALSIVGCKSNQSEKDLVYLECSRTLQDNGEKWITKYAINIEANTVDFYSQLDSFSKPVKYGPDKVEITDTNIIISGHGVSMDLGGETTINRSTLKLRFKYPHGASLEASCKSIEDPA
ncbi:hypothetical protein [Prochlorococcus marinus]|uniref:hypothetical protein n=1 Tax=Prochlorococcus marinus TaxID=1219 RepID=UPI0022B30253|nr:hypothetical protein [Prochlorococcus marinus]